MKRLAVLLVLAFPLSLAARADDASQRAKAEQLVTVLHTDRMVQQVATGLAKQYSDAAEHSIGNNPTPDQAKQIADFEKKISQTVDAQLSWTAVQSAFIDMYAKSFTEQELDATRRKPILQLNFAARRLTWYRRLHANLRLARHPACHRRLL